MTHQELCAELYALKPEWTDTEKAWRDTDTDAPFVGSNNKNGTFGWGYPAYDLEWCLAKLRSLPNIQECGIQIYIDGTRFDNQIMSDVRFMLPPYGSKDPNPTNAALKLLIELVKQNILPTERGK